MTAHLLPIKSCPPALNPDEFTPREALEVLHRLRTLLRGRVSGDG